MEVLFLIAVVLSGLFFKALEPSIDKFASKHLRAESSLNRFIMGLHLLIVLALSICFFIFIIWIYEKLGFFV